MNEDRAFALLVRASSSSNIKLRDIAQDLADKCNGMWARSPTPVGGGTEGDPNP